MINFKDTDYLYASSRVRALEPKMIKKGDLLKMSRAKNLEEAYKMVQDAGIGQDYSPQEFEKALTADLVETYRLTEELSKSDVLIPLFRLKYDGHNLKTLVKAHKLKTDPQELLSRLGNIKPEELAKQYRDDKYENVHPLLAHAVREATEVLAKTGDPQQVDTRIDKAVYQVMLETAQTMDCRYIQNIVKNQIDIFNIRAFVRIKRMKKSLDFLKKILVEGGTIGIDRFTVSYGKGYDEFFDQIRNSSAGRYLEPSYEQVRSGDSLSEFEKLCDNYINKIAQEAKRVAFGVEPVVAYLLAKENEIRGIRIVLASKAAGTKPQLIEERLRDMYE